MGSQTGRPKPQPAIGETPAVPWNALRREAKERFGISHFRPGQREALEAVFEGRDVLALMPTGAGKSLCYQLPALFLPSPVVVVSPLIALMRDQQEKAQGAEIAVEKLDSTLSASASAEARQSIEAGIPQLLYVTPEQLQNADFVAMLANTGVSLMAVDEAHCISQWGHDFRPAYLGLREARVKLGNPPVIALTATASEAVAEDILTQLGARDAVLVNTGIERENLFMAVHHTVNTVAKQKRLMEMIAGGPGSGIVYAASIRTATEIYEWLKGDGIAAGIYHGRLSAKERERAQMDFMHGGLKVLIATKAFGMGIDKPDIRFVYHYEFPDSLETYYQEAGRAGRDGKPAQAVLLYRLEDRRVQKFFLAGRYPRVEDAMRLYSALATPASVLELATRASLSRRKTQVLLHLFQQGGLVTRGRRGYVLSRAARKSHQAAEETASRCAEPEHEGWAGDIERQLEKLLTSYENRGRSDQERLDEMMHYAESPECRKQLLRQYFGEEAGEPCGACDNCGALRTEEIPQMQQSRAQVAVRVETAVGPILTTAPETLPQKDESGFKAGELIRHRVFGRGKILDLDGENLVARFDKGGTRKVRFTYVQKVA